MAEENKPTYEDVRKRALALPLEDRVWLLEELLKHEKQEREADE